MCNNTQEPETKEEWKAAYFAMMKRAQKAEAEAARLRRAILGHKYAMREALGSTSPEDDASDIDDTLYAALTPAETDSDQEVQGEGTGCTCQLCGSKYTVDFNVPDDVWETIREGKNLLCPVCIARKIEDLPGFAAYELQTTKQGEG